MNQIILLSDNKGSAVIEFLIGGIVFCLFMMGSFQMMLLYEAHVRLQQATFEAARHAIVNHGTIETIREGFIQNSLDLYAQGTGNNEILKSYALSQTAATLPLSQGGAGLEVERLNPVHEAFQDWGIRQNNTTFIPNTWLQFKSRTPGEKSGLSIQDANILKIKIKYGFPLEVPVIDRILAATLSRINPVNQHYYRSTPARIPLTYTAVMHMQSDIYE